MRLTRRGGDWYRTLYRVKVADWQPRRADLLRALRRGRALPWAAARDYDGIVVEKVMVPFDIASHPFGRYIAAHGQPVVNVPGGLITRVAEAFQTQLRPGGVFVSADVGDFGFCHLPPYYDTGVSGVAARFRIDDYRLAKTILQKAFGLDVTLLSFHDLTRRHLPPDWHHHATPDEILQLTKNPTHGVMLAKRPT